MATHDGLPGNDASTNELNQQKQVDENIAQKFLLEADELSSKTSWNWAKAHPEYRTEQANQNDLRDQLNKMPSAQRDQVILDMIQDNQAELLKNPSGDQLVLNTDRYGKVTEIYRRPTTPEEKHEYANTARNLGIKEKIQDLDKAKEDAEKATAKAKEDAEKAAAKAKEDAEKAAAKTKEDAAEKAAAKTKEDAAEKATKDAVTTINQGLFGTADQTGLAQASRGEGTSQVAKDILGPGASKEAVHDLSHALLKDWEKRTGLHNSEDALRSINPDDTLIDSRNIRTIYDNSQAFRDWYKAQLKEQGQNLNDDQIKKLLGSPDEHYTAADHRHAKAAADKATGDKTAADKTAADKAAADKAAGGGDTTVTSTNDNSSDPVNPKDPEAVNDELVKEARAANDNLAQGLIGKIEEKASFWGNDRDGMLKIVQNMSDAEKNAYKTDPEFRNAVFNEVVQRMSGAVNFTRQELEARSFLNDLYPDPDLDRLAHDDGISSQWGFNVKFNTASGGDSP